MIATLLALVLAQTVASDSEVNGAMNAAQIAAAAAVAGTRTISPLSASRACIQFAGGGSAPPGSVTVSFGVSLLSPDFQEIVGLDLPPSVPDWAAARDEYSYIEIQAVPSATRDATTFPIYLELEPNEQFTLAGPTMAQCEILLLRRDNASVPFRCACSEDIGNSCQVGGSAAPVHTTLAPGTWSGGGCQVKPCAARYEGGADLSWPSNCP